MPPVEDQPSSRNVIISGGARGIGRALTRMMLEANHRAFVFDIDHDELEHTTKVHLKKFYDEGKVQCAVCDLRNVEDIRSSVKTAAKFFDDRIDVLINNGGIASPQWRDGKTMEDLSTMDEWQGYIDTNLTAPFAMSQACIPYMKARASDFEEGAHTMNENNSSPAGPCVRNSNTKTHMKHTDQYPWPIRLFILAHSAHTNPTQTKKAMLQVNPDSSA